MVSGILAAGEASGGFDESYRLANGLKVVLVPQPGNPVISVSVLVKVGSSFESGAKEHGLAHLMEHMAFKGTESRGVGEVSAEVENNGGSINAYTSIDSTVYHLSLPADKLDLALDVLSDIVFRPTYDPDEYAAEKEVVVEEIKMAEDNPEHVLWDEFMALVFPNHPYGHRVLGSAESVRGAGRQTALAFHDRYYRADNAVVFVTGGFDSDQAKDLLAARFGTLPAPIGRLAGPPAPGKDSRPAGPVVVKIENELVTVPKIIVGFRCASGGDPEAPLADLLSSVMTQGRSGRLFENLKSRQGLVTDISTFPYTAVLDGVFVVQMETEAAKILPALEGMVAELNRLASEPPSADELARARAMAAKSFVDRQETAESMGSLLTSFELYTGDYRLKDAYLSQWGRVTPIDLARLAQRTFTADNLVLVMLLPKADPAAPAAPAGPTEEAVKAALSGLAPKAPDSSLAPAAAFEEHVLESGARVLLMRDPTLPVVNVRLSFMGGLLAESPETEGISNVMTQVWAKATETMGSEEFTRAVEDLGAWIDSYSGRNTVSLNASFMSSNWLEGLDLLVDVLTRPAFAPENIEEARQETLAYIKAQEERLAERMVKRLRASLFAGHPYRFDPVGTIGTVSGFTRDDLLAHYRRLARPGNLVLAVSGDIEPKIVMEALERRLAGWNPDGEAAAVAVPPPPPAQTARRGSDDAVDAAQAHLGLAFLAPGLGHPDQAALEILDGHLSGMGGPLFNELRNKRSLAYSVGSSYNPGLETGAFMFYIASDAQKTADALAGILGIIETVRTTPITAEELQGAIRFVSGTKKIQQQTLSNRSDEAVFSTLYGLGLDYNARHMAALAEVTVEDVQRVAVQYLDPAKFDLAVVGSRQAVDAAMALVGARKGE